MKCCVFIAPFNDILYYQYYEEQSWLILPLVILIVRTFELLEPLQNKALTKISSASFLFGDWKPLKGSKEYPID